MQITPEEATALFPLIVADQSGYGPVERYLLEDGRTLIGEPPHGDGLSSWSLH